MDKREKKKILFIINTMGRAGAETALIELLKKLDTMGIYELYLYVIIPCGELFEGLPDNVHILNKRILTTSLLSYQGRVSIALSVVYSFFYKLTGFRLLRYMVNSIKEQKKSGGKLQYDKLLWRLLATGRPDMLGDYDLAVAYIEGAATYFLADKVKASRKAAFVHIDYQRAGYTRHLDKDCYKFMDKIFVVSQEVGEKFCWVYPQYRDKVRLFRNLLNREEIIRKAKSGLGFTDAYTGIRLVTVGRLHYQKGYDIAIKALAKLKEEGYDLRWYVIGEGMERKNLQILIKKYGLEEDFILMGAKDNPYPYIRQADIYVQATRFEGKSIAIEEAQILGKVILASDCTGNREQIKDGYDGVLFTLTVENLVRELKNVISKPELQEKYAEHVLEKKINFPEDIQALLGLLSGN